MIEQKDSSNSDDKVGVVATVLLLIKSKGKEFESELPIILAGMLKYMSLKDKNFVLRDEKLVENYLSCLFKKTMLAYKAILWLEDNENFTLRF